MRFQTLYEGRHFLVPSLLAAIFGGWLAADWSGWLWLCIPAALVFLFCVNFFRDPDRRIPGGADIVVAAADGVIDAIEIAEESEVLKRPCRRVSIFLNVFDVHVNRAPIAGRITYTKHHPGTYLDARDPYCHQRQTPSLPGTDPRSDRFRCGGRESKFLAVLVFCPRRTAITCAFLRPSQQSVPCVPFRATH